MSIQNYGHSFRILGVFRFKYDCYNWYSLKENIWIFQMFSFLLFMRKRFLISLVLNVLSISDSLLIRNYFIP